MTASRFRFSTLDADGRVPGTARERRATTTAVELSPRAIWLEVRGYQTTVVRGDASALVIDPLDEERARDIIAFVHERLGLAVTAVAYSHHHGDHIRGVGVLKEAGAREIYALDACADLVRARGRYAEPTRVLHDGESFRFDGVDITGHLIGGHSVDLAAFLVGDVAHAPDLVHPAQAEFFGFGGAVDLASYESALAAISALHWQRMTAGHGQLGVPADVRLVREYVAELRSLVAAALEPVRDVGVARDGDDPLSAAGRLRDGVRDAVLPELLGAWARRLPGLARTAPSHIERAFDALAYFE